MKSPKTVKETESSGYRTLFSAKCFEADLEEWLDFVCRCRDGEEDYLQYDFIKCGKLIKRKFGFVEMD